MDGHGSVRLSDIARGWAARTPRALALRDPTHSLDYTGLIHAIEPPVARLRALGITGGERVLIVSENNVASAVWCLAAQAAGALPGILNARAGKGELKRIRELITPRVIVYAVEHAPAVAALLPAGGVQSVADEGCGRISFEVIEESHAARVMPAEVDIGLLLFTSGTTGMPKAVMWRHEGLQALGEVLAHSRHTRPGSVVTAAGPLAHIMGIANLATALVAGAALHLMPRLDTAALARAIAAGELTHLSLVPTAYARLCDHLERESLTLAGSGLRYISSGGAPLDAALKARTEGLLGLPLVNGYGMTECAPGSRTRPEIDSPASCIGWPEEGTEMKLVETTPSGGTDVGELWMRSRSMMAGYFDDPQATAAALRSGGWLATGDLARRLEDGSYEIVGRCKDLIIRSGFNVYPAEVEGALSALPDVLLCGVVGCPEPDGNEQIVAFVQLREGSAPKPQELIAALRDHLASYKRPSRVILVDALPLGPTGKVQRARLQALARELA
jgi:long-chain acyl-CoA synthetase